MVWTWLPEWPLDGTQFDVVQQAAARWQERSDSKAAWRCFAGCGGHGGTDGIDFSAHRTSRRLFLFVKKLSRSERRRGNVKRCGRPTQNPVSLFQQLLVSNEAPLWSCVCVCVCVWAEKRNPSSSSGSIHPAVSFRLPLNGFVTHKSYANELVALNSTQNW